MSRRHKPGKPASEGDRIGVLAGYFGFWDENHPNPQSKIQNGVNAGFRRLARAAAEQPGRV
jgi:hypothetical protein